MKIDSQATSWISALIGSGRASKGVGIRAGAKAGMKAAMLRSTDYVKFESLQPRTLFAATVTPLPSVPVEDHPVGCSCGIHGTDFPVVHALPASGYDPNAKEIYLPRLEVNNWAGGQAAAVANSPLTPALSENGGGASFLASPISNGSLATKVAYIAAGHGRLYLNGAWNWERGLLGTTTDTDQQREDHGNADQLAFTAQYLLNAGATVVPSRPIGNQPAEVIVDNRQATYTGSWSGGASTPYYSSAADNGALGDTATALGGRYGVASGSLTETATATFTPTIATTGFYPVYAWALDGNNRAKDQTYRVNYAGGAVEVKVNHQYTGKGWVYLGTYYFEQGTNGNVQVSNKTADPTKVIIADAIRFGNGIGDTVRGAGVSGQRREDEAATYWINSARGWTGTATRDNTVATSTGDTDDFSDNIGGQPRYFGYMNNSGAGNLQERLHISYHSNASGGSARGSIGLVSSSSPTPNQAYWAALISDEIDNDFVALDGQFEANWFNRSSATFTGAYGELSNSNFTANSPGGTTAEMDGTIIEVAFHDNATDRRLLLDPKVRNALARSTYHAYIKYFNNFSANSGLSNSTTLPEPVARTRAVPQANDDVLVSWVAGPTGTGTSEAYGDAATGYIVQASVNGYGFTTIATLGNVTSYTVPSATAAQYTHYRVVATNTGGSSLPGEVVSAKADVGTTGTVLIVDGFSRLDRFTNDATQVGVGGYRARVYYNNTGNYTVDAATSILASNSSLGFATATSADIEAGVVSMTNFASVVWLAGEQATMQINGSNTPALSSTNQTFISNFLNGGGKLFISGSEVGFDLVTRNQGPTFITNTLRAGYVGDDANTFTASGVAGSIFSGIASLTFDDGDTIFSGGKYAVEFPDILSASGGSTLALNYSGGAGGAAVQYSSGNTRLVYMGFPFETITTLANRNAVMDAVLDFFGTTPPATPVPGTPVLAAASDSGVSSSDGITFFNNASVARAPVFTVTGTVAGATVQVLAGGTVIGTALATGTTTVVTADGTTVIPSGSNNITARQNLPGSGLSGDSSSASLTIDVTAPSLDVLDVSPDPRNTSVASVLLLFTENVFGLSTTGISLTRDGGANLLVGSEPITGSGGTFSLGGLSSITTASGQYVLSVSSSNFTATDLAGNTISGNASDAFAVNVISGDAVANFNDTIRLVPAGGTSVNIFVNNPGSSPNFVWSFPVGTDLTINTLGGNDTVTVEGSLPMPVRVLGGTGTNDRIRILPAGAVTYDVAALELTTPAASVTFTGVESLETLAATSLLISGSAASEALTLGDHPSGSQLSGTSNAVAFPNLVFADVPIDLDTQPGAAADSLVLASGNHVLDDILGSATSVDVQSSAAVTLNKAVAFSSVSIRTGGSITAAAGRNAPVRGTALLLETGSVLDLNDNNLVLDYDVSSPSTDVMAAIADGRLVSDADFGGASTKLAVFEAEGLGLTEFAGFALSGPALLGRYTFTGDANLDGSVDSFDYSVIDDNFGGSGLGFLGGDLNDDGVIDSFDYSAIDDLFGSTGLA